jgi:peroxiredoxin
MWSAGCGAGSAETAVPAPAAAGGEIQLGAQEEPNGERLVRAIDPEEVVPPFTVTTIEGESIDSAALVGQQPFVVFYFATWCPYCDDKITLVRDALAPFDVEVIGVAVDEAETLDAVPSYVREHGFDYPVVLAADHPAFALAYNPLGAVPFLLVVGGDGMLSHGQMGYDPTDGLRLSHAVNATLASRFIPEGSPAARR